MLGIILGTICLVLLIGTIRRERYFRRHGYPQPRHGYHGCGYGCGGYGGDGPAPHHPPPGASPAEPPSSETTPARGATP